MSDVTRSPVRFVKHPDWAALFDLDAAQARAARQRKLDLAAAERPHVAFYHAGFPANGMIAKISPGYESIPVQWGAPV